MKVNIEASSQREAEEKVRKSLVIHKTVKVVENNPSEDDVVNYLLDLFKMKR